MKKIYLTIDDFPTITSEEMIGFLSQKKITGIIFCIGENLLKYEDVAIKALSNGFVLANHSFTHPHFSKISLKKALDEIRKTDYVLKKIYDKAGIPWTKKHFRFPYGDKGDGMLGHIFAKSDNKGKNLNKQNIQDELAVLGYVNPGISGINYAYYSDHLSRDRDMHWTLDGMEWCLKRKGGLFGLTNEKDVLHRLFSRNPFDCRGEVPEKEYGMIFPFSDEVLLLHDNEMTFQFFRTMITAIVEKGFTFGCFQGIKER